MDSELQNVHTERMETATDYDAYAFSQHLARYMFLRRMVEGKTILDIACGQGYGSFLMKSWGATRVTGVDIEVSAINKAKANYLQENLGYECSDAVEFLKSCRSESFDVVVSMETVEHLTNPTVFLEEIRRVVKKGGVIVVSCPNDFWFYGDASGNPYHLKKYTFEDYKNLCESALGQYGNYFLGSAIHGFSVVEKRDLSVPRSSGLKNAISKSKLGEVFQVPATVEFELTEHNCAFYLGVWGRNDMKDAHCLYPVSMDYDVWNLSDSKAKTIETLKIELASYTSLKMLKLLVRRALRSIQVWK